DDLAGFDPVVGVVVGLRDADVRLDDFGVDAGGRFLRAAAFVLPREMGGVGGRLFGGGPAVRRGVLGSRGDDEFDRVVAAARRVVVGGGEVDFVGNVGGADCLAPAGWRSGDAVDLGFCVDQFGEAFAAEEVFELPVEERGAFGDDQFRGVGDRLADR